MSSSSTPRSSSSQSLSSTTVRSSSTNPPSLSSSRSPSSQGQSSTPTPRPSSQLNSPPTSSIDQPVLSSTLTQFPATNTEVPRQKGFFSSPGSVAATFTVVGILALILLILLMCCLRYRKNQLPQARARERRVTLQHNPSTISRQQSYAKKSFNSVTEEQTLEHMEGGFALHGLIKRQVDAGDEKQYPRLAEISPGITIGYRDPNSGDPLDRQVYRPKPQSPHYYHSFTTVDNALVINSPQTYLPPPSWRQIPRPPSSPSIYPTTLPGDRDDDAARQLSTPVNMTYPEIASVLNQSSNYDAIATRPDPCNTPGDPMTPPNLAGDSNCPKIPPMNPPCDLPRQSFPPPIPPKSPLRKVHSMRAASKVQARESKAE